MFGWRKTDRTTPAREPEESADGIPTVKFAPTRVAVASELCKPGHEVAFTMGSRILRQKIGLAFLSANFAIQAVAEFR